MRSEKIFRVVCPTCKSVMRVDAETGIVIHRTGEKERPSLDDMLMREKNNKSNTADRFEAAMRSENERKQRIEEKFNAALEHIDELEDPTNPFDLD